MAWVQLWRGEARAAEESADTGIAICTEQGFAVYLAWLMVARGGAIARQGRGEEGVAALRKGVAAWEATGIRLGYPKMYSMLADAYLQVGRPGEAFEYLAEAMKLEAETGDRLFHAELQRQQGRVLLASSPGARGKAQEHFRESLATAHSQQARSLELRAGLNLAQSLREEGRRSEAIDVLAPIHDWFSEGFDTSDVMAARSLLDQLR
jgi:predicted ATPase